MYFFRFVVWCVMPQSFCNSPIFFLSRSTKNFVQIIILNTRGQHFHNLHKHVLPYSDFSQQCELYTKALLKFSTAIDPTSRQQVEMEGIANILNSANLTTKQQVTHCLNYTDIEPISQLLQNMNEIVQRTGTTFI